MNASTLPTFCGISLAAMAAAGASHWWSVEQWVSAFPANLPVHGPHQPMKKPTEPLGPTPPSEPLASQQPVAPDPSQKNFYEAMVEKMKTLESYHKNIENQNRDLVDQMAETNRDMMKLEFRVDTHSESFRPMPVSEDPADLSLGDDTGVLPPRAELILPELDQSPVP